MARWTDEHNEMMKEMIDKGRSLKSIAEELGFSLGTLKIRSARLKDLFEQDQFKPQKAGSRTYVNSAMKEPLKENWTPSRPGAMDHAKIRSGGAMKNAFTQKPDMTKWVNDQKISERNKRNGAFGAAALNMKNGGKK